MSRLAFVLFKYFPFGGLQRDFMGIAMAASARGFAVDVYTMSWEGPYPDDLNIIIIPVRGLTNHGRYAHFVKLFEAYRQQQNYAAVIGFNKIPGLDFYYAADPCFAIKCKPWRHYIPRYQWFAESEWEVFARDKETIILALSSAQIAAFQHYYLTPSQRFHLLPPWLKIDSFKHVDKVLCRQKFVEELDLPPQSKWILQVGSGFRTKGLDRSLRALAALPMHQASKVCLIVIGHDNPDAFKRLITQLKLVTPVYFIGGRHDIPEWMCAADLLLHPAYAENTGNVLLEAIASELPVLTTAVCGYAYHVTQAKAGVVLSEPFTQAALNHALIKWLTKGITPAYDRDYLATMDLTVMPEQVVSLIQTHINVKKHVIIPPAKVVTSEGWLLQAVVNECPTILCYKQKTAQFNWSVIFSLPGKMARKMRERETLKITFGHGNYFIKRFLPSSFMKSLWNYCFNAKSLGAIPEYIAVNRLKALKIPTLDIAGFGVENKIGRGSFMMTHEIQGVNLEDYSRYWLRIKPTRAIKLAVITQLAVTLRVMHRYGINHRDCYLCHFWLDAQQVLPAGNINSLALLVMDLHRAQIRIKVPARWKIKDLGSLLYSAWQIPLTTRDLCRFIEAYTDSPWRESYQSQLSFWAQVLKKSLRLRKRESRLGLVTPDNQWMRELLEKVEG